MASNVFKGDFEELIKISSPHLTCDYDVLAHAEQGKRVIDVGWWRFGLKLKLIITSKRRNKKYLLVVIVEGGNAPRSASDKDSKHIQIQTRKKCLAVRLIFLKLKMALAIQMNLILKAQLE